MIERLINHSITKIIEEFADIFNEFEIMSLYIFGNTISGKDIDLVMVSDSFKGISLHKRKLLVQKSSKKIDPICFTCWEFEKFKLSNSSLWKEFIKSGILIYGCERRFN
ncbi:hypothetical protein OHD16_13055 [Sphingobacterium sp. ML3W]|uniref:hypothetical protein n=1 Tax=Sphingobacterium sp. ML3W TaxID=1538644 RepID=UPI00249C47C7|nr:hypothetical protein [Sphingobacterium sp. ML3W]WFA80888.1 hypothetical protein OGI71_06200 [Sphingobacterium sp. ML3W]